MNIRKNIDYSTMFDAMRVAMSADMSQTKLYYELGRLICQRTEKGAAVAAAEYLQQNYPHVSGLSPRNLRRMRDFYRLYEGTPELLDQAMQIGWTQNVVILEADLNTAERCWYLCAVRRWGWSKAELQRKIESQAHQEAYLDESKDQCYTERIHGAIDSSAEKAKAESRHSSQSPVYQHCEIRHLRLTFSLIHVVLSCYKLPKQTGPPTRSYCIDARDDSVQKYTYTRSPKCTEAG